MSLSTSAVESVIVSTVLCVFNEVKETCFLSIFYISPDSLRLFFFNFTVYKYSISKLKDFLLLRYTVVIKHLAQKNPLPMLKIHVN